MMLTPTRQLHRAELKTRVRAEYLELPGLSLTVPQASRLCASTPEECQAVLEELVADGVLCRVRNVYVRVDQSRRCA